MANGEDDDGDYEVGYAKPPKHSQWKKGQSGNPSGKTKKSVSIEAKLKELAEKEIVVIENGTQVSMTKLEAMLAAVLMKSMKADMQAVRFVTETLGIGSEEQIPAVASALTANDLAVLESHADWQKVVEDAHAELDAGSDPNAEDGDADPTD